MNSEKVLTRVQKPYKISHMDYYSNDVEHDNGRWLYQTTRTYGASHSECLPSFGTINTCATKNKRKTTNKKHPMRTTTKKKERAFLYRMIGYYKFFFFSFFFRFRVEDLNFFG
jgi:hypothetical protein